MISGRTKRKWGFAIHSDCTDTIQQISQNPTELFASLYDEYFEKVNRYLRYRIGDYWDADDVTAIVFTKAYEACSRDGISEHFGPWIFRIAHNAYVDFLRKKGRAFYSSQELPNDLTTGVWQTEEDFMQREHTRTLQDMLIQLPEEYRDVISMKYIAELRISEISEVLERTEGATKTLLYRAMRKLRSMYEQLEGREQDEK